MQELVKRYTQMSMTLSNHVSTYYSVYENRENTWNGDPSTLCLGVPEGFYRAIWEDILSNSAEVIIQVTEHLIYAWYVPEEDRTI